MTLPNFLIIGAQKAGTTCLKFNLARHPEIFLANRKINFFEKNFEEDLDWYESPFARANSYIAIGEKTFEYIYHIKVHERIKKYLLDVKSIVVLKNSVTRTLSHLNHLLRKGHIPPSANFNKVIFSPKSFIFSRDFYYKQLTSYFKFSDPEKVLILINEEDIAVDPNIALARGCNFLEVDSKFEYSNSN